jgi:hypothetical protein
MQIEPSKTVQALEGALLALMRLPRESRAHIETEEMRGKLCDMLALEMGVSADHVRGLMEGKAELHKTLLGLFDGLATRAKEPRS